MTNEEKKVFVEYYTEQRIRYIWESHCLMKMYNEPRIKHDDHEISSMKDRRLSHEIESDCLRYIFNNMKMDIFPTDEEVGEKVKERYGVETLLFDFD